MKKAPMTGAGGRGAARSSVLRNDGLVHSSTPTRHHVLTDGRGRYRWLLCRRTGALTQLTGVMA
jgi:hypothetical protein